MSNLELKNTALGIEFGSTRIKAVLIDDSHNILAVGTHDWENRRENGVWTYSLDAAWTGIREAYANLAAAFRDSFGIQLTEVGAIGISGMMHGYLPFDKNGNQLASFRTWRNTMTEQAASELRELFGFNIPQRWSIAHLYQAILNGEEHTKEIDYLTTLAGYIHWQLTGERAMGVGEASGMFPVSDTEGSYDRGMIAKFNDILKKRGYSYTIEEILPKVYSAGECAGHLSEEGVRLLDPSGTIKAGIPMCPPEGDAGTGMVATNSVAARTGNISAGTSMFAMVVLEKPLEKVYPAINVLNTPTGKPVAMVHSNTCTSDLDAWVKMLGEMASASGAELTKDQLYTLFYQKALEGDPDCGGLINYNYYAGEPAVDVDYGIPMFLRRSEAKLTLANFARVQLYSAMAVLKIGTDILLAENVQLDSLTGHGGLFKVPGVGQRLLAGALKTPITVMKTAGEGGPWGMALLASFMKHKENNEKFEDYLAQKVFASAEGSTLNPQPGDSEGFDAFMENYKAGLPAEKSASAALR